MRQAHKDARHTFKDVYFIGTSPFRHDEEARELLKTPVMGVFSMGRWACVCTRIKECFY